VASWLVRSTSAQAVWVRALAGDIALCSWARYFTPTVPLSNGYKWVPVNLMLGVTLRWTSIPSRGGVGILLVASCYIETGDMRQPDGPLGSYFFFSI